MTLLAEFSIKKGIQCSQLITGGALYRNKSIDDKEAIEYITKVADECLEYSKSMLIFDVDSMVNLEKSETNPGNTYH